MRNFLKIFTPGVIVGLLLGSPFVALAAAFLVTQGGTGQTTFTQGVIYSPGGTKAFQSTATTSATCAGTVSCTTFTVFGSAPITITGAGGSSGVATTSFAATFPILLSTSPLINYSFGGLSTTSPWTVGNLAMVSDLNHITSVGTSTPTVTAPLTYSGTLGNFVGGVSGAFACATCSTASGANPSVNVTLAVQNGAANTFLRSDGAPALSQAIAPTWTALHFFAAGATSTAFTAYNYLATPTSTAPTLSVNGQIAMNTTAASSSIQAFSGGQFGLYATTSVSFSYSTTTPWAPTGTTTIPIVLGPRGQVFNNMACKVIGVTNATTTVAIGSGTATSTYYLASTGTPAPTTLTANNSFQAWQTLFIAMGSPGSTNVNSVTCGFGRSYSY